MNPIILEFFEVFRTFFYPPVPYRGQSGANWLVSRVWSDYMREWLPCHYLVDFEHPLNEHRRLDAALRSKPKGNGQRGGRIDIALEWEWDNNKVADDFLSGDFRKLFEVNAHCGLAIVQTRADGNRRSTQADETVRDVQLLCKEYRRDTRSVALIEIRRVLHQKDRVEFLCYFQDLDAAGSRRPLAGSIRDQPSS